MSEPLDNSSSRASPTALPPSDAPPQRDSITWGIGLGFLVLAAHLPLALIPAFAVVLIVAGFTQWIAVIPLTIALRRAGRRATAKGLLIAAGVFCFLNTACCGVLLASFSLH